MTNGYTGQVERVEATTAPDLAPQFAEGALDVTTGALREGIGVRDMPTIDWPRSPSGNSRIYWDIPAIDDEPQQPQEYLTGIILGGTRGRNYYEKSFSEEKTAPTCISADGITGYGQPGGDCATCALSAFGQGCTSRTWLFFLRAGFYLPTVIPVPVTSVDVVKKYQTTLLAMRGKMLWDVVTRLYLEPYTTRGGFTVARLAPRVYTWDLPYAGTKLAETAGQLVGQFRREVKQMGPAVVKLDDEGNGDTTVTLDEEADDLPF